MIVDTDQWKQRIITLREQVVDMKRGSMEPQAVQKNLWRAVVDMNTKERDVASGFVGFCRLPTGLLTDSLLRGFNEEIRKCVRAASDSIEKNPLRAQRQLQKAEKVLDDMTVLGDAMASGSLQSSI